MHNTATMRLSEDSLVECMTPAPTFPLGATALLPMLHEFCTCMLAQAAEQNLQPAECTTNTCCSSISR